MLRLGLTFKGLKFRVIGLLKCMKSTVSAVELGCLRLTGILFGLACLIIGLFVSVFKGFSGILFVRLTRWVCLSGWKSCFVYLIGACRLETTLLSGCGYLICYLFQVTLSDSCYWLISP